MTRGKFHEKLNDLIVYSLNFSDVEETEGLSVELLDKSRKACNLFYIARSAQLFMVEAVVGSIEGVIYSRIDAENKKKKFNAVRYTGLEFSETNCTIPDNALEYITNAEVRDICFDLSDQFEKEVQRQYSVYQTRQTSLSLTK